MKTMTCLFSLAALPLLLSAPGQVAAQDSPGSGENLPTELVDSLNSTFGRHPGARAVHAAGVVLEGSFTAASDAKAISTAPHLQKGTVPVTIRFSDFAGLPDVADNDPQLSSPRGLAIKFHLPDGSDSDIVSHSVNGFPVRTAAEFRDLFIAIGKSGPAAPKPTLLDGYLSSHPIAKDFLTSPKPAPASFATLPFFGVNTFKFTNAAGHVTYGRYRIIPVAGELYLSGAVAASMSHTYLRDEIVDRVKKGPVSFKLMLQIAGSRDVIDDPSVALPSNRKLVELGTLHITKAVADSDNAQKVLLFMPDALPAGIEPADPMISIRTAAYAVSFGRRQEP